MEMGNQSGMVADCAAACCYRIKVGRSQRQPMVKSGDSPFIYRCP
jgi:hypothetical protein